MNPRCAMCPRGLLQRLVRQESAPRFSHYHTSTYKHHRSLDRLEDSCILLDARRHTQRAYIMRWIDAPWTACDLPLSHLEPFRLYHSSNKVHRNIALQALADR